MNLTSPEDPPEVPDHPAKPRAAPEVLTPSRTADTQEREFLEGEYGGVDSADQQREFERSESLASTYYFAKVICGFEDLTPSLHAAMCEWVDREAQFKCGLAPRGHLKSSCWTIARNLRVATANPNLRILITNEIILNGQKWLSVMQEIVQSPIYRWLFPEVVPEPKKVRWNQNQLELNREAMLPQPTIEVIGVGGASTSNHYEHITNDDPVGKEARESPTVMQKAIDHRKLCWSLLVDPSKDSIHDVGTRWAPRDYLDWVVSNVEDLDFFKLGIFAPDGNPIWPERFTSHVVKAIRKEQGPAMWSLQYLNEALADGAVDFNPDHLRTWRARTGQDGQNWIVLQRPRGEGGDLSYRLEDLYRFEIVDAGLSPESPDARTAVVTLGVTPPGPAGEPFNVVLLGARAKRSAPDETVQFAHDEFLRLDPISCSIEVFGGHQTFFYWLRQRYPHMRVRKLKTDTSRNAKGRRIRTFYPFVEQHRFFVSEDQVEFLEEFVAFPNGRTVDLLDAVSYGPQVWSVPPRSEAREFQLSEWVNDEAGREASRRTANSITGYATALAVASLLTTVAGLV